MSVSFNLPSYLAPLPPSDPAYAGLNQSAYDYAYGPTPGDGNLKEFEIVTFVETHYAYRLYGGNATECGYWWVLAPDNNCYEPTLNPVSYDTYADTYFAVCPEWNSGTDIRRCTIPVGYSAVVGIGQTADCSDGQVLTPDQSVFQLNGDVCSAAGDGECLSCASDVDSLIDSTCVNECATDSPTLAPDSTSLPSSASMVQQNPLCLILALASAVSIFTRKI